MPTFHYTHAGRTYTVQLERDGDNYVATLDGQTMHISASAFGVDGLRLTFGDGAPISTVVVGEGEARHVWIGGESISLSVAEAAETNASRQRGRKSGRAGSEKRLTASMPGQIRAVLVSAGDTVTAGQTLVVLEAMKMELRASASADGVVGRIFVKVGDVVERGATLVELV